MYIYMYVPIYIYMYVPIYICLYLYIYCLYIHVYRSIYHHIYIGRCQISNNSFVIVGFVPKHVDLGQQKLECIGQDSSKFLKSLSSLLPSNCPVEILMGRWWFLFQCFLGSQQENTNFSFLKHLWEILSVTVGMQNQTFSGPGTTKRQITYGQHQKWIG